MKDVIHEPNARLRMDGPELSTFWMEFYMEEDRVLLIGSTPERHARNISYMQSQLDNRAPYLFFSCAEGFMTIPLPKMLYSLADPLPPELDEDEEEGGT